jgi:hypothetical protein
MPGVGNIRGIRTKIGEAQRIAGELVKMHRDGAIGGEDLEAQFYAQVLHTFGGTYLGKHRIPNV